MDMIVESTSTSFVAAIDHELRKVRTDEVAVWEACAMSPRTGWI